MLTLYYFNMACSTASHFLLEESGLSYQARHVDMKNDVERDALRQFNPKGTVPTLLTKDGVLTENIAIMTYIADLVPTAHLLPTNSIQRAQCMSFLSWGASTVHINCRQGNRPERFSADPSAFESIRANGRRLFLDNLQAIDARLQDNEWIVGSKFSAADGYALRFYEWGVAFKQPMEGLKAYEAFKDRMLQRPAIRRVLELEGSKLVR
jgi:glutathione S-transferase